MERDHLVEQVRRYFAAAPDEAIAAYLFGSVARGEARLGSDVDIAVLFDPSPPAQLGALPQRIEADLERSLSAPVEVVVLNRAPADLVHRVLRDGVIVLDRDRSARLDFEVRRRNEFFDLQPILERYRAGTHAP